YDFFGHTEKISLSADGNIVAFLSRSTTLIDADVNGTVVDAYIHNILSGETIQAATHPSLDIENISLSADGNKLAYQMDDGGVDRIFVYTVNLDSTSLISRNDAGDYANGDSRGPVISGNGDYIVFVSEATNLDPADTGTEFDVYRRDLIINETVLVNKDSGGLRIPSSYYFYFNNGYVQPYDINYNGQTVVIPVRDFDELSEDSNNTYDVVVKDMLSNAFIGLNQSTLAVYGAGSSSNPSIDYMGTKVVFSSYADNVIDNDNNGMSDMLCRDLDANTTVALDKTAQTVAGITPGEIGDIDYTGRYMVYSSGAKNIVPSDDDSYKYERVYLHDAQLNSTISLSQESGHSVSSARMPRIDDSATRISYLGRVSLDYGAFLYSVSDKTVIQLDVHTDSTLGNGDVGNLNISPNGTHAVFSSEADNLHANDADVTTDIFIRNIDAATTTLVSVHSSGVKGNDESDNPACSNDGGLIVFQSAASNLVDLDINTASDIFLREGSTTTLLSRYADGSLGNGDSSFPDIDSAGRYVVFSSKADNLVDDDSNNTDDVFLYDHDDGSLRLISKHTDGTQGNGPSYGAYINSDGTHVIYSSRARNLVDESSLYNSYVLIYDITNNTTELLSDHLTSGHYVAPIYGDSRPDRLAVSGDGSFASCDWMYQLWRFAIVPTGSL
ncbi:MAG: PD40 domain-containing protein, partial [Planctomycetes bacterium]|nr:PD40 domain-containing protein [Planctomycetota bacterium]